MDANGHENLYIVMQEKFQNVGLVILYVASMISLAYHLLHGFSSAFQSLGLNHVKYNSIIKSAGVWFSIIISVLFALMPLSIYLGIVK
jgi:succinate dehydrogenase / fumarate reductase, cytochrome b subunit